MKRKIITILSTFLIIISSTISSFSNPIAAATISYEALMALMGIGVAFGLALPQSDEEYWDYTRSLKNHLQVVDDEYLDLLDKSVKEWKTNNNNKPDNEKEPLKVPFIPNLKTLFDNVGKDVSNEFYYVNPLLNPIPYISSSSDLSIIKMHDINNDGSYYGFDYYDIDNIKHTLYIKKTNSFLNYAVDQTDTWSGFNIGDFSSVSLIVQKDNTSKNRVGIAYKTSSGISSSFVSPRQYMKDELYKPSISYIPSNPSFENDELVIPNGLPSINIPSIDTVPGYEEGIEPPFEVQPPINIETPPGTDTETPPGTDTNFPSFPSFGDNLDFSPMYLTNVTEKFPFSLPWDMGRIISLFDVDPVAPVFEVPIISETITLDLTEFSELAAIVRFFVLIGFILSLIFISTKLMA